ncbi:MAG: hypothetical protein KatS3mg060_3312 [Dehalococcoidia bacterium]|nr:MAG: hypothetical protein KatS3mg060_3312 [Dehalococcoidia bacterium]
MPSVTILHVDDRPEDRARVAREIARDLPDARVLPIAGAAALQDALSQPVDLVITDHQLDWTDGLGVLACVNAEQPGIPVIMLTANGNEEVAVAGLKAGLDDYLPKSALHRLGGAIRTALDRAESRRRAATADAATRRAFERQRVVAEAARDFAAARHDVATIADRLARIAATTIGDLATVQIRLQEDISLALLAAHHPDPAIEARMRAHYEAAPIQRGEGLTGRILETGEPVVLNGKSTAEIQGQLKPEYRSFVEELGLTAVLAVPLQATGQVLGVVACARYDPNRPYSADDLLVLEELAGCAALALESAVLYLSAQEALRARDRVLSMATS